MDEYGSPAGAGRGCPPGGGVAAGCHLSDSVNLAGLPGLVVPCGLDKTGLPIGLQLIGKAFNEETLLNAGFAFQKATDFHTVSPETIAK